MPPVNSSICPRPQSQSLYIHKQLENKFNKDLITNFPQNHTDIKNDITSRNLTLKKTLRNKRKKKWQKFKRRNHVIRTLCKSTKVYNFVEVSLERSKYVDVTDNRKNRKRISKDSCQELKNDKLKNFSRSKKVVIEKQTDTDVVL